MRAQLLYLSGPSRGRTVTYAVPRVTVGSAPHSTAYLPAEGVAADHARIDWEQDRCAFHLHAHDGQVFVNGNEVREVILQDDDEIEFGVDGPRARFRVYVPEGAVCKPVRRMLADAEAVRRVSGSSAATQALTRDLFTQATLTLKIGFPIAVVALAFLAGWLGGWLSGRPSAEERRRTADMVTQSELTELRSEQEKQREAIAQLSRANANLRRIQREWSHGVCLVHGVFGLRQQDGSWLEHDSTPLEAEYTGSGFLVSSQGDIVTNRHVVVPWSEMPDIEPLIEGGMTPEFMHLTATFPGRGPIAIPPDSIRARADSRDVAVVRVPADRVEGVPVLPLAQTDRADYQRATVVGYPTGLAALLARADRGLVDDLQRRQASMTMAIDELAAAGQINPVITQGSVNVEERVITYDAATTHGGSGGPVFGDDGEVIAVNFAIQRGFTGLNYGVPIRFARELLSR
ncbi:MAG: trypsin-like peptidase domain-containing protein [Planctomycetes bacterium]|nr:trypsin-like peptidase domain-containing protein [Planctomycetota bacterium]